MYFNSPKDFTGFRDKPSGAVLLEECNVRTREDRSGPQQKSFMCVHARPRPRPLRVRRPPYRDRRFVLSHAAGESVVLAADSEKEMLEWMQAVRTSRMCITDPEAAAQPEADRREAAAKEVDLAMGASVDTDTMAIERELEAIQQEHKQVGLEKERAEKELKELMARFKLRKSLLHWRHRKLTFSFRALITIVFRQRIQQAHKVRAYADAQLATMDGEAAAVVGARQKAEAAKRKADEKLQKEMAMKKEGEAEARECERIFRDETAKAMAAQAELDALQGTPIPKPSEPVAAEVLELNLMLEQLKAKGEVLQTQMRRKGAVQMAK